MPRTFLDSTTVGDLVDHYNGQPVDGFLAYRDGLYANEAAIKARFPHHPVVGITVKGAPGAPICDTEPGNIGLPAAAQWAADEVNAGRRPTLYYLWSDNDRIRAEVAKHLGRIKRRRVNYFPAHYDGVPVVPAGCVGKQYRSPDGTGAGFAAAHYDVSVVADYWPGVDPKPAPRLSPVTTHLARRLTRRLTRRTKPVNKAGRAVLTALHAQIARVLNVK